MVCERVLIVTSLRGKIPYSKVLVCERVIYASSLDTNVC